MFPFHTYLDQFMPSAQINVIPIVAGLVFGFVFLITLLVTKGYFARNEIKKRAIYGGAMGGEDHLADPRSIRHKGIVEAVALLQRAARFSSDKDKVFSKTRYELIKAGYFGSRAVSLFYAARIGLALALPVAFLYAKLLLNLQVPSLALLLSVISLTLLGLILPGFYLSYRQSAMGQEYRHGFPDFMDLLIICVEAGLSLEAAIERVSRELIDSHPHLAVNIHLVSLELRAGKPLSEAMSGLSDRTGIEEVQSLGALLKQSEELGTSLATALRVYSDEMRDKRFSRAEEKAHALPVKMVLPLGLFIFPVMMILILLPAVVRMQAIFG